MAEIVGSVLSVVVSRLILKIQEIKALSGECKNLKEILEKLGPVIELISREDLMLNSEYQGLLAMLNTALSNTEQVIDHIAAHPTRAKIQSGKYLQILSDSMADIDRWINRTQLIATGLAADAKIQLQMLQKQVFFFHNEVRMDMQQMKMDIINSVENVPREVLRLMKEEQAAMQAVQGQSQNYEPAFMPASAEKDMHSRLVQWMIKSVHIVPRNAERYAALCIERGIGNKERLDRMLTKNSRLLFEMGIEEMDAEDIKKALSSYSSGPSYSSDSKHQAQQPAPVGAPFDINHDLKSSDGSYKLHYAQPEPYSYRIGGEPPQNLTSSDSKAQIKTVEAITPLRPTFNDAEFENMRRSGNVEGLVRLLAESSAEGKLEAAMALRFMADNVQNQVRLVQSGGIPHLVALLIDGGDEARAHAACIMGFLSNQNPLYAQGLVSAGGIPALLGLLQGTENIEIKTYVAWAIGNIAQCLVTAVGEIVEVGCIRFLVHLLKIGTSDVNASSQAAWALRNIAAAGPPYQIAIARAHAVKPLMELIKSGKKETNTQAIWALRNISAGAHGDINIGAIGGIKPLLRLLHEGTPDEQAQVAEVFSNLVMNHDCLVAMAAEGGVPMMTMLLRISKSEAAKGQVAGALRNISMNVGNLERIGRAGAVPLLVQLLHSTPLLEHKLNAVWTLYNLCGNEYNRSLFNKEELSVLDYWMANSKGELQSTCEMIKRRIKANEKKQGFFQSIFGKGKK